MNPPPDKMAKKEQILKKPIVRFRETAAPGIRTAFRERGSLFLLLLWLLATCVGMGGCVSQHSGLALMEGGLFVEPIPSSRVSLSNIIVRQEGDELVITGEVRRLNTGFSGIGHVDVAVVSPGGTVINHAHAAYTPKILPKTPGARKHRPSRFEVHLHCVPPKGSVVRAAYHGKPAQDDPLTDCEDNFAVPHDHDHGG